MGNRYKAWMTTGLITALAVTSSAQVLKKVVVTGDKLNIVGTDLDSPKISHNGKIWDIEFGAKLQGKASYRKVRSNGVRYVCWGWIQAKPPVVRVRVVLDKEGDMPAISLNDTPLEGAKEATDNPVLAEAKTKEPSYVDPHPMAEPRLDPIVPISRASGNVLSTPSEPTAPAKVAISLNFTDTDIVQILRAIAVQSHANIVTSPEVKGKLTVNLQNVSIEDALRIVTAMSGVQFAEVSGSYLVAPVGKLAEIVSLVKNLAPEALPALETRLVNVFSGDLSAIRAAMLKTIDMTPADGLIKPYQVLLPSDEVKLSKSDTKQQAPKEGDKDGVQSPGSNLELTAAKNIGEAATSIKGSKTEEIALKGLKDQYLLIIGPSGVGMTEMERRIHELDMAIASAYGISIPTTNGANPLMRETYKLKSEIMATDLVRTLATGADNFRANVDLYPTPKEFLNQQIVVVGRKANVDRMMLMLADLDVAGYGRELQVYDVKNTDPRSLRETLVAQVRGLRVAIAPITVATFDVYKEGKTTSQSNEVVSEGPQQAKTGTSGGDQAQQQTQKKNDDYASLEQPFDRQELVAQPMRLILRGTKDQLDEAAKLITMLDVAPKQVAIDLRVMELTHEQAVQAGIDWSIFTGGAVKFIRLNNAQDTVGNSIGAHISAPNFAGDVVATLDKISTKTNLIARPNMVALDGRQLYRIDYDEPKRSDNHDGQSGGWSAIVGTAACRI